MNKLLHIDSSASPRGSISRKLTAEFAAAWRRTRAGEKVIYRDLDKAPVPAVNHHLIAALGAAPGTLLSDDQKRALAVSNLLVDELFEADTYVLGVPLYNFSVPGSFKAWMDQVARKDRILRNGTQGFAGALGSKKVLIVATRKDEQQAGEDPHAGWDFHEPYLRAYFGFLGVKDFAYIPVVQNPLHAPEVQAAHLEKARDSIREILARWNTQELHALEEAAHKVAA